MTQDSSTSNLPRTLGWAVYLGVSWTWCIGMFLPVLLLRDLGTPAFFAFAIPNVLGAAAMGWVLKSAKQSHAMTHRHMLACVWFSLITILFHAFFAAWIIRRLTGPMGGVSVAVVFLVFWMIFLAARGGIIGASVLTLLISLGAFGLLLFHGLIPKVAQPIAGAVTNGQPIDVLWLAPVCLLGFALCPYLDLTFHHAYQELDKSRARIAFTVGFCVIFALMLAFTFCYSGWLPGTHSQRLSYPILVDLLGAHLVVQTCFTVAAHAQRLAPEIRRITMRQFLVFSTACVVVVLLGVLDGAGRPIYHGMGLGELTYRSFMVFYGLIFPAYVWLKIIPGTRPGSDSIFAGTIILAAPFYWLGFIERHMLWLIPGVLIVVLARMMLKARYFPVANNS